MTALCLPDQKFRSISAFFIWTSCGDTLYISYPFIAHLQTPFRGANLTPLQISWNKEMSSARVSVKWVFGDIINYFKFLDFRKNLMIAMLFDTNGLVAKENKTFKH